MVLRVDTVEAVYVVNVRLKLHLYVITFFCLHKILIENIRRGILNSVR